MIIYANRTKFENSTGSLIINDIFSPMQLEVHPWNQHLKIEIIRPGFKGIDLSTENFNLLHLEYADDGDNPVAMFLQCIPLEIRENLNKFKYLQLQMMQLLSTLNWEEYLSNEQLILLWLLMGKAVSKGWTLQQQREIIESGLDNLLGTLYESPYLNLNDLKKISSDGHLDEAVFHGLDFVTSTGAGSSLLKSLSFIPAKLPRLMKKYSQMADSMLLYSVFNQHRDYYQVIKVLDPMCKTWQKIISLSGILKIENPGGRLNKIQNQDILYKSYEKLIERVESLEFPEPPLEGTGTIIPLRRPTDLFWALQGEHYLSSAYCERVNDGSCYFYEVKGHDDTIILIKVDIESESGGLKLGDVWSPGGGVPFETQTLIEEWFEQTSK